MRTLLIKYVENIRGSYWFAPGCMVLLAIALGLLMPWLDQRLAIDLEGPLGWLSQTQTDGARAVLSTIGSSILGVAGTVFSITIVAVSFASGNFGPRLISNFMRDRGNQITLGTFIATFVYCLVVLRRVHDSSSGEGSSAEYAAFVPHLSVLVALVLALASVGVLIFFIHHVPETINVDRLVAGIGQRLRSGVLDLFPDPESVRHGHGDDEGRGGGSDKGRGGGDGGRAGKGDATGDESDSENDEGGGDKENAVELLDVARRSSTVTMGSSGFVQAVDLESLEELAAKHALILRLQYRPGDFVIGSDAAIDVQAPEEPDEKLVAALRGCFVIGRQRTERQNCLFLADQLVEVIARAMSPGVNDPLTAMACLDWARDAMTAFVERDTAMPVRERPWRRATVRVRPIDFERLVGTLFDKTRQYVASDRDVAMHALTVLVETAVRASRDEHREVLLTRMRALRQAAGEALPPALAADVERRHDEALRLLDDETERERHRDGGGWFGGSG